MSKNDFESTNDIRKSWAKSLKEMHNAGDDNLLINDVFEDEAIDLWELNEVKILEKKDSIKQTFVD